MGGRAPPRRAEPFLLGGWAGAAGRAFSAAGPLPERQLKALNWLGENSFPVWVKPRAGRNQVLGLREGALHVSLTAPPVENKANEALVRFLAEVLALRPRQVEIVSGEHSRHKIVRVGDVPPEELRRRMDEVLRSV